MAAQEIQSKDNILGLLGKYIIYNNKVAVCLFVCPTQLSPTGAKTINSVNNFCITIAQVLVQTVMLLLFQYPN